MSAVVEVREQQGYKQVLTKFDTISGLPFFHLINE